MRVIPSKKARELLSRQREQHVQSNRVKTAKHNRRKVKVHSVWRSGQMLEREKVGLKEMGSDFILFLFF